MTTSHTPGRYTAGPWIVTNDTDIIGTENDPENGCVGPVDVAHVYLRTVPGRTEGNAHLIAAAPDLLEALKDLMYWDNGKPEWEAARAAIAKAEGRA